MQGSSKKSIFEYSDYREFLKSYYEEAKEKDKKFSFRYFAKAAGFKSSSVLKNIIDGKRNIASYNLEIYAKVLKLNKEETLYFKNLVLLNQSQTPEEKQKYTEAILRCRLFKKIYPLSQSQFNFYSKWYTAVIWELTELSAFKEDPQWISKHLSPSPTLFEIKKAIEDLIKLGLLKRNKHGRLLKSSTNISTLNEVTSPVIAQWHREMMKRASESISRIRREDRDISSITFKMSKKLMPKIKEKIIEFRRELVEMQKFDSSGPDAIYQLNLQFFPHFIVPQEPEEEEGKE